MIYLCTPYSHPDALVREARFKCAAVISARFIVEGKQIFCPITHSHPINLAMGDTRCGFEHWKEFDFFMLDKCDELWVVRMPGWEISKGITQEM